MKILYKKYPDKEHYPQPKNFFHIVLKKASTEKAVSDTDNVKRPEYYLLINL